MVAAAVWLIPDWCPAHPPPAVAAASVPCGLQGRVRFVDSRAEADYLVRFVDGPADMRVQMVDERPQRAGEWRPVRGSADFTVMATDGLADFTVRLVDISPGCP